MDGFPQLADIAVRLSTNGSKPENGLTLRERRFLEEYSKIAKKQGKDAVIRRENKTKRRKKKKRP